MRRPRRPPFAMGLQSEQIRSPLGQNPLENPPRFSKTRIRVGYGHVHVVLPVWEELLGWRPVGVSSPLSRNRTARSRYSGEGTRSAKMA